MQIRTKLTLQFTALVGVILILFFITIYPISVTDRQEAFFALLKDNTINIARLYAKDIVELNSSDINAILQNSNTNLPLEKISIYDLQNNLLFSSDSKTIINKDVLNKIKNEKEVKYEENEREAIGILYQGKYQQFIVILSAYDKYGKSYLRFSRFISLLRVIITIFLTIIAGLFFARQALQSMANVVTQVDKINISNLHTRVDEGNGTDEIALLAITFNKMLERLEAAFDMQKSFIANASHELRTPLTSLTGQLEVSLMNDKINADTKLLLESLLEDIKNLNRLSNGLLDLAQANLDITEIRVTKLRIDELIGLARAELIKRNKDYTINVNFNEFPDNEEKLIVNGNEQLLKVALINIIKNACKYSSNKTADIKISFNADGINIVIADKGIGIHKNDLKYIFEPFFRSENAKPFPGHGIGLTLTQRIIKLHKGAINISSELNAGTSVLIFLPLKF